MARRNVSVGAPGNIAPPIENVIKAAQRNEEQGYDAIWWPDHLMSWWPQSIWQPDLIPLASVQPSPHIYLDAVATMAAVGVSTKRVILGTSVTDPFRRPPAMLAQEFLSLDHITKGRVILGIGAGEGCNTYPYGIPYDKPIGHLEEALKIVRLLWENDQPVSFNGQFWQLDGAVNGMRPYQEGRYPPIWIGGSAPRTMRILGELADGWLPGGLSLEHWEACKAMIEQAAAAAGRDPSAITYGVWDSLIIGADHEECHRLLDTVAVRNSGLVAPASIYERYGHKHPLGERFHGPSEYIPSKIDRERALKALSEVPFDILHDKVAHGTPEELAESYEQYIRSGCRHVALSNITPVADLTKTGTSYKLMAELVKYLRGPHFL